MNKKVFKLDELNLPLEDLILEGDELLVIKGGTDISLFISRGSGCGCGCTAGNGCGCGCDNCGSGNGCGCGCQHGTSTGS